MCKTGWAYFIRVGINHSFHPALTEDLRTSFQKGVSVMSTTYTSIYDSADGVSHFREVVFEMTETILGPLIPPLGATAYMPAGSCYLLTFPPGIFIDWHPAPGRLFHFFLAGQCEVEVADGEARTFGVGDIVLAEDTRGKGHTTRNTGAVETLMAVVALAETPS
jgi:quercetin dioxygenase-like cupin family protein